MTTRSILGAVFGVLIPLLLAAQTSPGIDVGGKVSEAPQAVDHAADDEDHDGADEQRREPDEVLGVSEALPHETGPPV